MATYASSVAQNENIHILRGKGIGDVKADLRKPEKKDRKDRKALADLSKPAKHLGSTAVEASSLKEKYSQRGTKTTKKAQTSNILTDEETKKCFEWAEEEIEKVHFTGNDMLKHERDAIDKCVKEGVDMVLSCMGEWNWILYDYATPIKKIDDDIEDIKMLELEPEILSPWPSISRFSPTPGVDPGRRSAAESSRRICTHESDRASAGPPTSERRRRRRRGSRRASAGPPTTPTSERWSPDELRKEVKKLVDGSFAIASDRRSALSLCGELWRAMASGVDFGDIILEEPDDTPFEHFEFKLKEDFKGDTPS